MGILQLIRPDGKPVYLQADRIESFVPAHDNANHTILTLSSQRELHCIEPVDVVARLIEISANPGFAYAEKLIGTSDFICENKFVATSEGKTHFFRP